MRAGTVAGFRGVPVAVPARRVRMRHTVRRPSGSGPARYSQYTPNAAAIRASWGLPALALTADGGVYIGGGTLLLILIVLLVVWALRR